MANYWNLTDEQRARLVPRLKQYFNKLESMTDEEVEKADNEEFERDLTYEAISPQLLIDLLTEEFGYETWSHDCNGWQWDFWIEMHRKDDKTFPSACERMMICGCGMTFELCLRPEEF